MSETEALRSALRDIYDSARYPYAGNHGTPGSTFVAGECRWCGAAPPTEQRDHDVACPAAKAAYALRLPGYRDWVGVATILNHVQVDSPFGVIGCLHPDGTTNECDDLVKTKPRPPAE